MLGELVADARTRAAALRGRRRELETAVMQAPPPPSFLAALRGDAVSVVAEIKRSSPSRGEISPSLDPALQARAYRAGGAAAISVLTEGSRFGGSLGDLEAVSRVVSIPLLRKDFIVSEEQVLEARAAGASAILIIARAIEPELVVQLAAFARAVDTEPLVEVRNSDELATAIDAGARAVGLNARDLETLAMDSQIVLDLAPAVPSGCICLAESGITDRSGVERVAAAGVDAVLVGTALSAAADPRQAVSALTGVPRSERATGH